MSIQLSMTLAVEGRIDGQRAKLTASYTLTCHVHACIRVYNLLYVHVDILIMFMPT